VLKLAKYTKKIVFYNNKIENIGFLKLFFTNIVSYIKFIRFQPAWYKKGNKFFVTLSYYSLRITQTLI
jgi:predicted neuraminidase